ncbi:MAG: hypothetical protein JWM80_6618 [Cyanobacteria bacterium RYN_339]|nr:hypothetical protein [Cyanobacteria bacterium RYN_339]
MKKSLLVLASSVLLCEPANATVTSVGIGSGNLAGSTEFEIKKLLVDNDYYYNANIVYPTMVQYALEATTSNGTDTIQVDAGIVEDYVGDPRVPNDCGPPTSNPVASCDSPNVRKSFYVGHWNGNTGQYDYHVKQGIDVQTGKNVFKFIIQSNSYNDPSNRDWNAVVIINPTDDPDSDQAKWTYLSGDIVMNNNTGFSAFAGIFASDYMNTTSDTSGGTHTGADHWGDLKYFVPPTAPNQNGLHRVLQSDMQARQHIPADAASNNQYVWWDPNFSSYDIYIKFYGQ